MGAGWLVLRAEFRARWRTWLMLALIAAVFAGAVQAAAAGARRTDSAYPSLVAWSQPPDVLLYSFPGRSRTFGQFPMAAAARCKAFSDLPASWWHRRHREKGLRSMSI